MPAYNYYLYFKKILLLLTGFFLSFQVTQSVMAHGLRFHEFKPVDHRVGMDASAVYCVVQDNQGMIWMGTDHGLYNFDGYTARHFTLTPTDQNNDGVIYCAFMADSVHLWLGTDNGLSIFNTFKDSYEPSPPGLPENIRAICRINDHTFWIGSINGLYRYDTKSHKTERIRDDLLPHQAIYTILRYDDNTFYFGTYKGLCRYSLLNGKFDKLNLGNKNQGSNQLVLNLLPDYNRNCIWIGAEGGLYSFDPLTNQSQTYSLFQGNSVKSLLTDNQNCLWAGTDNGLYIFEPSTHNYKLLRHDATNDRSLINNVVWTIFADKQQNLWIGTDAGASQFLFNEQFHLQSISEITGSNEGNHIISLLSDKKGNIWLGGNNGLIKMDKVHGKTVWYQQNSPKFPIPHNKVRNIFEDSDGDIWIATDGSICRYNEKTSQFDRYQIEDVTHTRNANWAYAICQDETNKLWIATCLGGLFVADKQQLLKSGNRTYIAGKNYFANSGVQGLSGNMLQFLAMDARKNIWAGTYRAGVNQIDRLNQKVIQYTARDKSHPLPSDEVTALTNDADNYLWIALRNKIIRIDPTGKAMKTITDPRLNDNYINALTDDGKRIWMSVSSGLFFIDKRTLRIRQINTGGNYFGSIFYDKISRRILAGGINEFVEFDPESILGEDQHNNLFITSLTINDKITTDKLEQSIRFTRAIVLPFRENNMSFTFSELSYNQQQNMQYAGKLEGLDNDWHYQPRGYNRITYNNLPPGDYRFLISRVGMDGNPLPDPLIFAVKIRPPWYASWLAKGLYLILILILVAGLINYYLVLNRLRYERIEKVKTMELTAHKIDFLTNISHELKTPLSLIIGPLGKMMDRIKPGGLRDDLAEVRQNALKMGALIHQLMEASRQEFDGFGLIISRTDIIAFVQSLVSVFEKPLEERGIQIKIQTNLPSFHMEADILKLEVILNNLLSNASRFAPDRSTITVSIDTREDQIQIKVNDEGPGIDPHDLPHVFERFYQSKHNRPQNKDGSGVGLSIVKEYVQLHRGKVEIISDGVKGTCVEITLPVKQMVEESDTTPQPVSPVMEESLTHKPLLLIVEDNVEISGFIARSLGKEFRCLIAQNGKSGLETALNHLPDIIVSDIMMPVMDGIEMCKKLKDNISTSPIPVILLTAKDDKNTELQGYKIGADAFIAKPFEIGYLSDRLHQLLRGRNMLVQKARQEAIIQTKEIDAISADEKLLSNITLIIENEITNPDLNVSVLSELSGYSMKQIYRRIKSLTGQTAVDYIRSVRLKKAAMLLSRKTFTVAEVMYMVGFSNHSYFAKRFQELYGKTPKQFSEDDNNIS